MQSKYIIPKGSLAAMETTYRVLRIDEQLYGCEELPAGQPVL